MNCYTIYYHASFDNFHQIWLLLYIQATSTGRAIELINQVLRGLDIDELTIFDADESDIKDLHLLPVKPTNKKECIEVLEKNEFDEL